MKKFFSCCVFFGILLLSSIVVTPQVAAQTSADQPQEFSRAKIVEIVSETQLPNDGSGNPLFTQELKAEREDTHERVPISVGTEIQPLSENQRYRIGTEVIITHQQITQDHSEYVIVDKYRLNGMAWLAIGFFGLVLLISRKQGALSILGMFLSLGVLMFFIVPQIIAGQNPVLITLAGAGVVSVITIYLSHGFRTESHIALLSMFLTLAAVGALSYAAVHFVYLAGLGSEDALYLQFGSTAKVNLQGLLLGGIMLAALGVLDDITLAQVSVVNQLREAKPHISWSELYSRGLAVGKDHVASLVNTLVMAYAASSLPLFLLFSTYTAQPAWVSLNSEIIAEEVVRTLTGSIGLVLAVPLTTFIASYFAMLKPVHELPATKKDSASHGHIH